MPEADSVIADRYYPEVAQRYFPYSLKGSTALDWGMQNRLARIFDPADNRTVMLAIDHGYFQGPTSGLERVDAGGVTRNDQLRALDTSRGGGGRDSSTAADAFDVQLADVCGTGTAFDIGVICNFDHGIDLFGAQPPGFELNAEIVLVRGRDLSQYPADHTPAQSQAKVAAEIYERLITQTKVDAILGPYSSPITEAVADIAEKYRMPMVAPNAATTSIFRKGRKFIFMVHSPAEVYLEGLIDIVRRTREAEVSCVLKQDGDGMVRVSLRSLGDVDVSRIAEIEHGGGHRFAAGFTTDDPIPAVVARILDAL